MPVFDSHKNFAYSTVATAPSPATSGTSLVVAAAGGLLFPTPPFNVTIWPTAAQPSSANAEIARVTAIATDTFTITRAQEATAARTVVVGDQIAATISAKIMTDLEGGYSSSISFTADQSIKRVTITDTNVATSSKVHLGAVRRADITDVADPGWIYVANLVTISNGSFDVLVAAFDLDGETLAAPNESVTLFYKIWS